MTSIVQILETIEESDYSDNCSSDEETTEQDFQNMHSSLLNKALYAIASMTVPEFGLCIGQLKSTSNQSNTHTCLILKLIIMILPKPNNCPATFRVFKKYVNGVGETTIKKQILFKLRIYYRTGQ